MIHQIVADGVMLPRLDRDLDFRADAVGAGDEDGSPGLGRHAKHPAEAAEASASTRRERRLDEPLDARLGVIGGVDVDTGGAIVQRTTIVGHVSSSCSNATSR